MKGEKLKWLKSNWDLTDCQSRKSSSLRVTIVTAMTANPNFPAPDPPLGDVTTGANELETAFNNAEIVRQDSQEKTSVQNQKEADLRLLLTRLALNVEGTSSGDTVKIQSAGMDVRSPATSLMVLGTEVSK